MKYQELSPWADKQGAEPTLAVRELRSRLRWKRFFLLTVDFALFCSLAAITAVGLGLVVL